MPTIPVNFEYRTGLRGAVFLGARLTGSWNGQGMRSDQWSTVADAGIHGRRRLPGLSRDRPARRQPDRPDVPLGRVGRHAPNGRTSGASRPRSATPPRPIATAPSRCARADQTERYYLTHCRRLGANKLFVPSGGRAGDPLRRVGAERAQVVELVRGEVEPAATSGTTAAASPRPSRCTAARTASGRPTSRMRPTLADFAGFDHTPYMFRITRDDGSIAYRTDLYSRCQIGSGDVNPERRGRRTWSGRRAGPRRRQELLGRHRSGAGGAAVPRGRREGQPVWPETAVVRPTTDFWRDEFDPDRPLPTRLDDLVIYELHVDGLGVGRSRARHARRRDRSCSTTCVDLGVNAVELMPMSEFEGWVELGLRHLALPRDRVRRRRARPVQALRPRLPPPRHRRAPRRRLQPLHPRRRARRVGVRLTTRPRATSTTGTRAAPADYPTPIRPARRLHRQRLDRLGAALLGGDGPPAVHQQRRGAARASSTSTASGSIRPRRSTRTRCSTPTAGRPDNARIFGAEVPARMDAARCS